MANENENMDKGYGIFDGVSDVKWFKLADGEERIIGIQSRRCDYVVFKEKNGAAQEPRPAVILELDFVDAPVEHVYEWTITAKYLKDQIEIFETADLDEPNLFGWFFKVKRAGMELKTKYIITPIRPRKKETTQKKITKEEEVAAYL